MSTPSTITVTVAPPVATVTLNRPESRNAMSGDMVRELLACFAELRERGEREDIRVVQLRGAGQTFCAGGDVHDLSAVLSDDEQTAAASQLDELLVAVRNAPHVVIARVHGHALGGGLGLVCVADIAVAGYSARLGLPEPRLGLVPAIISPYVVERIGLGRARRLMLTGVRMDPYQAWSAGLVDEVCADLELDARVQAVISEVLQCSPLALRESKRLLRHIATEPDTLQYRINLLNEMRVAHDAEQGIGAFLRKVPPPWTPHP